jgi:hypothetical protein
MANPDLSSIKESKFLRFDVIKDQTTSVDIRNGISEVSYYESILTPTSNMEVTVIDVGGGNVGGRQTNILSGFLRGGEQVDIIIEDSQGTKLKQTLFVNTIKSADVGTQKVSLDMSLFPREYLSNEQTRVVKRYDGKISESIKRILKDPRIFNLTDSQIDIEDTDNVYNFIGNDRKPFYVLDWLSPKSIPSGKTGSCAGFFFFKTSEGYKFKSVDGLLAQSPKRKYVYSNTPPSKSSESYDGSYGRILQYSIDENIDIQNKMQIGTYNTRILYFDPYTFKVDAVINSATSAQTISAERSGDSESQQVAKSSPQKGNATTAGKTLDFIDGKFLDPDKPCRLMCVVKDNGNLPSGRTSTKQLEAWKSNPVLMNDRKDLTLHQSIARFNQLFSNKISITVPGDFSLRAGDVIYCEFPNPSRGNTAENSVNKELSGNYLIADVNQSVNRKYHYTYLNLVRDSVGRKVS